MNRLRFVDCGGAGAVTPTGPEARYLTPTAAAGLDAKAGAEAIRAFLTLKAAALLSGDPLLELLDRLTALRQVFAGQMDRAVPRRRSQLSPAPMPGRAFGRPAE